MRTIFLAVSAILMIGLIPGRPVAVESADKIASRAVLFAMFARQCRDYWDLDYEKTGDFAMLFLKQGHELFGKKFFNDVLVKENAITSREYHRNGGNAWCAQTGGIFKQTGFDFLFRTPTSKK